MTTEVFEYALIRVVPRVERGEQINAGIILYSKRYRYLTTKIQLNERRLLALAPDINLESVRNALTAFEKARAEGPLAEQPLGERFRWLTAPRSAIVQPGPVHSGVTDNPAAELDRLFDRLVATGLPRPFPLRGGGSAGAAGAGSVAEVGQDRLERLGIAGGPVGA